MNILNHEENSEILHSDGHDVNSALKSSILNYMPSLKWLFVFIDNWLHLFEFLWVHKVCWNKYNLCMKISIESMFSSSNKKQTYK